jgi:hypothetical protein
MYIINIEISFKNFSVIFFEKIQMLSKHIHEDVSVEIKLHIIIYLFLRASLYSPLVKNHTSSYIAIKHTLDGCQSINQRNLIYIYLWWLESECAHTALTRLRIIDARVINQNSHFIVFIKPRYHIKLIWIRIHSQISFIRNQIVPLQLVESRLMASVRRSSSWRFFGTFYFSFFFSLWFIFFCTTRGGAPRVKKTMKQTIWFRPRVALIAYF